MVKTPIPFFLIVICSCIGNSSCRLAASSEGQFEAEAAYTIRKAAEAVGGGGRRIYELHVGEEKQKAGNLERVMVWNASM